MNILKFANGPVVISIAPTIIRVDTIARRYKIKATTADDCLVPPEAITFSLKAVYGRELLCFSILLIFFLA